MLAMFVIIALVRQLSADVSIENKGRWPRTWPGELEPLRAKSRTIEGPLGGYLTYEIPFSERDAFEASWPHLLKVQGPECSIVLVRSPYTAKGVAKGHSMKSGVVFRSWPLSTRTSASPTGEEFRKVAPRHRTAIVLIVDGKIVDLNRISLPKDCTIQDERFKVSGTTKE
jgi:hypothetical protein